MITSGTVIGEALCVWEISLWKESISKLQMYEGFNSQVWPDHTDRGPSKVSNFSPMLLSKIKPLVTFVRVYDMPQEPDASWQFRPYPWVNTVSGTNYCFIGLDVDADRGRIVVLSVLDSIGKGGALVGIENMNIMHGRPRTEGLDFPGLHPA